MPRVEQLMRYSIDEAINLIRRSQPTFMTRLSSILMILYYAQLCESVCPGYRQPTVPVALGLH
jgi:hypothetical protein